MKFQSTPSTRRETEIDIATALTVAFQSTPSTRRETSLIRCISFCKFISIHSLHTEGDLCLVLHPSSCYISIHSLHTEGDWIRISGCSCSV